MHFFPSETDAYKTLITERGTAIHYQSGLLKMYELEVTLFCIFGIINFLLHACTFHVLEFMSYAYFISTFIAQF